MSEMIFNGRRLRGTGMMGGNDYYGRREKQHTEEVGRYQEIPSGKGF